MCHVLIIEDEWLLATLVAELATQAGATSFAVATTECQAVEAALIAKPAVIISDVRLASGTGPKAVETIHTSLGPIPVIYVTGSPHECELTPNVAAILAKPVDPKALLSTFVTVTPELDTVSR